MGVKGRELRHEIGDMEKAIIKAKGKDFLAKEYARHKVRGPLGTIKKYGVLMMLTTAIKSAETGIPTISLPAPAATPPPPPPPKSKEAESAKSVLEQYQSLSGSAKTVFYRKNKLAIVQESREQGIAAKEPSAEAVSIVEQYRALSGAAKTNFYRKHKQEIARASR